MPRLPCTHQCPRCGSSDVSVGGAANAFSQCLSCGYEGKKPEFHGVQCDPRLVTRGHQNYRHGDRDYREFDWENFDPRSDQER